MRKIIGVAIVAVTTLGLTACGPEVDFWGNPVEPTGPAACEVPAAAPTKTVPGTDPARADSGDGWQVRPGDVPEGNSWILINVKIKAIDPDPAGVKERYCVPVEIHIEVEAVEEDTVLGNAPGGRAYDFVGLTPWENHYVPVSYDPRDPRFAGRPPVYAVRVEARYVEKEGFTAPQLLACSLDIHTGTVASGTQLPGNEAVRCALTLDVYDRYDQYQR